METYDGIIVGSGQAGNPLAKDLALKGWKIALVENKDVGGTCINRGCTPTKTLVASAREIYLAKRGRVYGIEIPEVIPDFAKIMDRKNRVVASFRQASLNSLNQAGVHLYHGRAEFIQSKTLRVLDAKGAETLLTAPSIFLNAGGRAFIPPIEGLETIPHLTSTTILELDQLPQHLLILGGGYIGIEFAQMFRRFGSQVTLIHRGATILSKEDPEVSQEVQKILEKEGIQFELKTQVHRFFQEEPASVSLEIEQGSQRSLIKGSQVLIAMGRIPNSDTLNLSQAGIEQDSKGYIKVDPKLETNIPGIYALGDLKGGPAFTHIAYDDYRIMRDNLLMGLNRTALDRQLPYTVFIDPSLGRIGMTEVEARASKQPILVGKLPMAHIARAIEMDETQGFLKVIVDQRSGLILGAAALGIEGGEIASMLQIAMMGKLPYEKLKNGVFSHPTLAESLNNLFGDLK